MHAIKHFKTITAHRHKVISHCAKAGILWQGLFHDLSKYSPTEFITGAKYLGVVVFAGAICYGLQLLILPSSILETATGSTIVARAQVIGVRFVILAILAVCIPNAIFYFLYHKREEFIYIKNIITRLFGKFIRKKA